MQGNVNENALCMYSYIEVDAEKIVARTYGVDVKGMVTSYNAGNVNAYNEFSTYVDGFMIY